MALCLLTLKRRLTMILKKEIKNRFLWMDLLNITAILGVIMMHTNDAQNHYVGVLTPEYVWACAVHSFFMWPVAAFYMLTGCNLLNYGGGNKHYISRRVKKVVIPFVAWSFFYWGIRCRDVTGIDFVNYFINGKFINIMWFFIPLFAIYMSIPFMRIMVINCSRKTTEIFLLLAFVFCSVCPFLSRLTPLEIDGNYFPMGSNFLWFAVLGYYLGNYEFTTKQRRIFYWLGGIAVIIHFAGFISINYFTGKQNLVFMNCTVPTSVLFVIAIFLKFRYSQWTNFNRFKRNVSAISSCTFGVYLIHIIVKHGLDILAPSIVNCYWGVIPIYTISLLAILFMKRIPLVKSFVP